jgi:hypothetical protein
VRMWAAALHHVGVAGELTALWAAMSSAAGLVLGRLPGETSWVEVMNELTAKFHELEELCSQLKGPSMRICNLLIGPSPGQACWVDQLEETVGRHEAAMARVIRRMPS